MRCNIYIAIAALLVAPMCTQEASAEKSTCTQNARAHAEHTEVAHSEHTKDIVDTAIAAGSFNSLAAAIQAADLIGALKGEGPFTVLAPTDG